MRLNIKSLLMWKINFGGEQAGLSDTNMSLKTQASKAYKKNWCEWSRELWLLLWMQDTRLSAN